MAEKWIDMVVDIGFCSFGEDITDEDIEKAIELLRSEWEEWKKDK